MLRWGERFSSTQPFAGKRSTFASTAACRPPRNQNERCAKCLRPCGRGCLTGCLRRCHSGCLAGLTSNEAPAEEPCRAPGVAGKIAQVRKVSGPGRPLLRVIARVTPDPAPPTTWGVASDVGRDAVQSGYCGVSRVGIEPTTLGLKGRVSLSHGVARVHKLSPTLDKSPATIPRVIKLSLRFTSRLRTGC